MNTKTAKQIEAMKAQKFGVEVEMVDITREKASAIAAGFFGTNRKRHAGGQHDAWVAYDQQGREWAFVHDGSLASRTYDESCEMTTPILTYDDMGTLLNLVKELRKAGAVSNANRRCGIHVHVDGAGHTPTSIRVLANTMAKYEQTLIKTVRIDRARMSSYCRTVDRTFLRKLNEEKPRTMTDVENIWYNTLGPYSRDAHYHTSRYHMLNLHSLFHGHGTLEFRLFQFDSPYVNANGERRRGGIHAGQLKAMIQLCLALSEFAKEKRTCGIVTGRTDVAKKTDMNRFFWKIGFVGDEFETARNYYMRNLEGGVAFKAPARTTHTSYVPHSALAPVTL